MCCLLQREAAAALGIATETYINWEKDRTRPVASQFRPVVAFLGYDPSPEAATLAERLQAKRRALGVTFHQVVQYLSVGMGAPLPAT
jgi:transcriptional regulator with XRE-family HTH domain